MGKIVIVYILVVLSFVAGIATQGFSAAPPAKDSGYPALSDREIGHIRWIVKLAQQLPGDWSYMGGEEEGQ